MLNLDNIVLVKILLRNGYEDLIIKQIIKNFTNNINNNFSI